MTGTKLQNWRELCDAVDGIGFLPLLHCGVPGFSVEALTDPAQWLQKTEDNPWEWRYRAAQSGRVVYGRLFRGKAGFVSREWLPVFANWRRRGYDFDALCEEGLISRGAGEVMRLFADGAALTEPEIRARAALPGGLLTELMMRTYLVISGFARKTDGRGRAYGWPAALYRTPEAQFGAQRVRGGYAEAPERSFERLFARCALCAPGAGEKEIRRLLGGA